MGRCIPGLAFIRKFQNADGIVSNGEMDIQVIIFQCNQPPRKYADVTHYFALCPVAKYKKRRKNSKINARNEGRICSEVNDDDH